MMRHFERMGLLSFLLVLMTWSVGCKGVKHVEMTCKSVSQKADDEAYQVSFWSVKGEKNPLNHSKDEATEIVSTSFDTGLVLKCTFRGAAGTMVRFREQTGTIQAEETSLKFDLRPYSKKQGFWGGGAAFQLFVKLPKQKAFKKVNLRVSMSATSSYKKSFRFWTNRKKELRQLSPGKDFQMKFKVSGNPGTTVALWGKTLRLELSGKGAMWVDMGPKLWNLSLGDFMYAKTHLKMRVYMPGSKSRKDSFLKEDKHFYYPTRELLLGVRKGKFKLPTLSTKGYPKVETTYVLWMPGKHRNSMSVELFKRSRRKIPLRALSHFVEIQEKPGKVRRCGPFRKTRNFGVTGYGKRVYYKILHLDAQVTLFDRAGKQIATRLFKNRKCPSLITNRKNPRSSFKYNGDKAWKRWVARQLR